MKLAPVPRSRPRLYDSAWKGVDFRPAGRKGGRAEDDDEQAAVFVHISGLIVRHLLEYQL